MQKGEMKVIIYVYYKNFLYIFSLEKNLLSN